ncbi:hypothetical protein [Streptomyces sp. NPDC048737]|uniref:hypothetical protein n=1 Tax=unclassified Streptomyces TaxID=2593676 RepID=UPI003419172F
MGALNPYAPHRRGTAEEVAASARASIAAAAHEEAGIGPEDLPLSEVYVLPAAF